MASRSTPSTFWPCFWLAVVVAAAKFVHWSLPSLSATRLGEYVTDLSVSSHADILFVLGLGIVGQGALLASARWPRLQRVVWWTFLGSCCVSAFYAVASVQIFAYLRSPLTYPLIYLAGDMRAMRSSLGSFVSARLVAAFVLVPVAWAAATWAMLRRVPPPPTLRRRAAQAVGLVALLAFIGVARHIRNGRWEDRDDHLISESPHWELIASCLGELAGGHTEPITVPFAKEDLQDFVARPAAGAVPAAPAVPRPRNVILLVLETTGTRYLSLYGSKYPTTPRLDAEAAHALVFDDFYCHVGMTANSLAAISLSIYPYMTWREYTVEYPAMPGTTLADVLRPRGYRTAFIHSGDLEYVQQDRFLQNRGFDDLMDYRVLGAGTQVSSWGAADRVLVDGALAWIDRDRSKPFYMMAWTIQSHHPYEPAPGQEEIDFFHGDIPPDDYDLGRYLNSLHEVDRQLGRLFDGLRERGLADDTLVAITGDHGEAFGDPHRTWGHGARLYEENVKVPLVLWNPRLYPSGRRSHAIGGHVDVNPTVLDVLGLPAPAGWHGRSMFDPSRPPRAYFYAANDDYLLGVREESWKYVYNATRGRDELYDLPRDPSELHNLAERHPETCQRLRRRLAAWRDYVGRELARLQRPTT